MTTISPTAVSPTRAWTWDRLRKYLVIPAFSHLIMAVTVVVIMFPMIYAFIISTQTPAEYTQFPPRFLPGAALMENVAHSWERINMGRLLMNTSIVALTVSIGKIVLSVLAAFAFVYFEFRGKTFFFVLILITHMLPLPVRIVPTFELIDAFNWINTYSGLTIPFFASATGVLLFRQLYRTIPPSLADAARIDGAGPLQFLWSVVVPLSRTNMAALFLIEFIYMWNQYLWPLIIANADRTRVVQIGLKQLVDTDAAINWNYVMAGVVLAMIPPLLVLVLLQRSLIEGMSLYEEK
ncbi:MAG: ABC transporter permease subunit [Chloroflexi bacterium]|nr:MAG: ABC transporter permease subunit [Chloroflexota bacterium]